MRSRDFSPECYRPYKSGNYRGDRVFEAIGAIVYIDKGQGDRVTGRSIPAVHLSVRSRDFPPECYRPYKSGNYWGDRVVEAIGAIVLTHQISPALN